MKPHRGHYRPLFGVGVGRSPPFLVAALTIGLCMLAFSYWRLALQYHDLEEQLKKLILKKDSLEANESFINKQLEIREENFSEAKVSLQKKEQEVEDLKKKGEQTVKELGEAKSNLDLIKQANDKLKSDTGEKERNLELLRSQNRVLESDKTKLESEVKEFKLKLAELIKNNTTLQQQQNPNSVYVKPDSAAKDPVFQLVNKLTQNQNPQAESNKPNDVLAPPPLVPAQESSKSSSSNIQNQPQLAPPPEPLKKPDNLKDLNLFDDKMKPAESKIEEILDPANMVAGGDDDEKDPDPKVDREEPHPVAAIPNTDLELKNSNLPKDNINKDGGVDNSINYEVNENKKNNPVDGLIDSINESN